MKKSYSKRMTVNSNNIEAYLLDYLEGSLDPVFTAELMAFLAEHPEYEKYLPDYDGSFSLSDSRPYLHKELLKKDFSDLPEITSENFDEFCIARCEALLSEADLNRLSDYISRHPASKRDFELYQRVRLQPDGSLHFPYKQKLKKNLRPFAYRYLYLAAGIAASIAVMLLLVLRQAPAPALTENTPVKNHQPIQDVKESTPLPVMAESRRNVVPVVATDNPSNKVNERIEPPARIQPVMDMLITSTVKEAEITGPSVSLKRELPENNSVPADFAGNNDRTPLGRLFSRIDIWKTAETAINGFNYLTESQLSVDKTTNESGKLTTLLIEGESYSTGIKFK